MIELLSPYLEYKDSKQPSFGQIPKHWKVVRNGQIFSQRNQTGFPNLPILEVSLKTGVRVRDFENSKRKQVLNDREKYKRVKKGDIAYNMMRMWQGAVGVAPVDGLVSPAYVVASPLSEVDSRYYSYLFRTHTYMNEVNKYSHGIVADRNRLYWDEFKQIPSLFPPREEQNQIVEYLDFQLAKINKFIKVKKKLISVLKEQKQAIINEAVTKGIHSNVKLKPSGIDWIGKIPNHWEVIRGKFLFKNNKELNTNNRCGNILSLTLRGVVKNCLDNPEGLVPKDYNTYQIFEKNDLVFKLIDLENFQTSRVGLVPERGIMSPAYIRLTSIQKNDIEYFYYQYFNLYLGRVYNNLGAGVRSTLSAKDLLEIPIVVPSYSEQVEIRNFIINNLRNIDNIISKTQDEINLITEYSTRLISDVVTGKVDVRDIFVDEVIREDIGIDNIEEEIDDNDEVVDSEECEV